MDRGTKIIIVGLAISLGLAAIVSPFASSLPDGLEWVADKLGFIEQGGKEVEVIKPPLPEYETPFVKNRGVSTAIAGIAGTLIVFCVTMLLMFTIKRIHKKS